MGNKEEATIRTLTAHRDVFAQSIEQHRGRVIDSLGDNLLAEFSSAIDAVRCASDVQAELADRYARLEDDRKMRSRIGINVGDVIVEAERIYGDGVNIDARVEALADGGGISITNSTSLSKECRTKIPRVLNVTR